MDRYVRWLVKRPWVVIAASLALTGALGFFAVRVRIESALETVLPTGDPAIAYYEEVRRLFGSDDVAVIGMRADDLFAPAALEKMAHVTSALEKIDGVERVLSLTNAVDPGADVVTPPKLVPQLPPPPEDIVALREKLARTPLYRQNLVSADLRGAAINVFFEPFANADYETRKIDDQIMAILAAAEGPEHFYYTGAEHVKKAAVDMMRTDLLRFTPLALGCIVGVLALSFRTKRGVLLPISTVLIGLVWTLGVIGYFGKAITLGTFVLPPLLLVLGSSYAMHVMARYYEQAEEGHPRDAVVVRGFERVWLALVVSAIANIIGFGSLMVNRIPAIFELGLFAVVGVALMMIANLTFLPAVLAVLPVERGALGARGTSTLTRMLGAIGRAAYGRQRMILGGSAVLAVVALVGVRAIRVDSDFLNYFSASSRVRQHNETINREIVGSNPFYLVVEGSEEGMLRRWEVLRLVKDLQTFLMTLPGITSTISLVDYLELLESGLNSSGTRDLVIDDYGNIVPASAPKPFWEESANLGPILKLIDTSPETFKAVVTKDFSKATVLVRTTLSGSQTIEATLAQIREYIAQHFPADLRVTPSGNLVLLTGTASDIVRGQIESLTIALVVIFIVMALMFLSVKIGLLAILPNVLPIVIFFGVMGWCGIDLNLGTSLIAAIALGIAVDSTIHYMARLNFELRGETDQAAAITRALRTVGVPIVYTTMALLLGFLTYAFSNFVPIRTFGILASVTLAGGLATNLVLLPALLSRTKIITLWDLVGVKLGKDPVRTIPLFKGLRPAQARVVVLMGEVKRFEPGEAIVRTGEQGDAMYVILGGRTDIMVGAGAARRSVAQMKRGDCFGEMGLVRHDVRTADVVAIDSVEVLELDERFLDRVQRRYPRIASKVFLNLTGILSNQVDRMTRLYMEKVA